MRKLVLLASLLALLGQAAFSQRSGRELLSVPVNGGSTAGFLEYEEHGSADGEPVILIQGSLIADAYLPVAREPALAEYRVLLVHLRGYAGSSVVEAPFGAPQHADDIVDLLQELGIERAHIVGHSYGGAIALQVAITAPELVQSLVLADPGTTLNVARMLNPGRPEPTPEQLRQGQQQRINSVSGTLEQRQAFLNEFLMNCLGDVDALEVIPGAYDQALTNGLAAMRVQFEFGPSLGVMGEFDPEVHLPALQQPILFMASSAQNWAAYADLVQRYYNNTQIYTFPDAPHCFTVLQPKEVAEVMSEFFAGNSI